MAFSNLMLTTGGKTLYAKAQQGKLFKVLRVAVGDGLLGSGSMINRTALVHEKLSMLIDAIVSTNEETESAIIVTLTNKDLTEGFYFRELGIFVEDPDTHAEVLYLYDNAGTDGEFINDGTGSVSINERLRLLVKLDSVANVTFEWSGNPLYLSAGDITPLLAQKADLGEDGKIVLAQLPDMDYDPAGSAAAVDSKLTAHMEDEDNPHGVTASQTGAAPATHAAQHAAGGSDPVTPAAIGAASTTHAAQHAANSSDPVTPADIGAAPEVHSHDATDIASGTLDSARLPTVPVAKGGTGKTSWTANRLIYPSAADTLAQLAFPSVAGSLLRQGTSGTPYWTSPADLVVAMGTATILSGSYTGTNTSGAGNKNSLTFSFTPKLIVILRQATVGGSNNSRECDAMIMAQGMTLAYPLNSVSSSYQNPCTVSWSGNTVSWYHTSGSIPQMNSSSNGYVSYYYVAIG